MSEKKVKFLKRKEIIIEKFIHSIPHFDLKVYY